MENRVRLHKLRSELHFLETQRDYRETYTKEESQSMLTRTTVSRFLERSPRRNTYAYPAQASRRATDNSKFWQKLIGAYESLNDDGDRVWCPVIQKYIRGDLMTAAHIIPQSLAPECFNDLCGLGAEFLRFSTRNGIMLSSRVAKAFDADKIGIVQTQDSSAAEPEFELIAFDPDCILWFPDGNEDLPIKASDLHCKPLKFIDNCPYRPARRLLFLKYAIARLNLLDERGASEWELNLKKELSTRKPWPTIGPYLVKTTFLEDAATWMGVRFDHEAMQDILESATDPADPYWRATITAELPAELRQLIAGAFVTHRLREEEAEEEDSENEQPEEEEAEEEGAEEEGAEEEGAEEEEAGQRLEDKIQKVKSQVERYHRMIQELKRDDGVESGSD